MLNLNLVSILFQVQWLHKPHSDVHDWQFKKGLCQIGLICMLASIKVQWCNFWGGNLSFPSDFPIPAKILPHSCGQMKIMQRHGLNQCFKLLIVRLHGLLAASTTMLIEAVRFYILHRLAKMKAVLLLSPTTQSNFLENIQVIAKYRHH